MGNGNSKENNRCGIYDYCSNGIQDCQKFEHPERYMPPFAAKWHRIIPESIEYPTARTGHFYSYYPNKDWAITGCGATAQHSLLDDIWALDLRTFKWMRLNITGSHISPRTGAKSTIIGDTLYVFGGFCDPVYFNELYAIDLTNFACSKIEGAGDIPSPRNAPLFSNFQDRLYVWGGYDGGWPSDLFVFDTHTSNWTKYPQSATGRSGQTFATIGQYIYCYMSAKNGGMYVVNMETNEVKQYQTSGCEPEDPNLLNAGLVPVDHYLFLLGGKSTNNFTLLYACDVIKMNWFLFYLIPDDETVNLRDGYINEEFNFMVPRTASMGIVYSPKSRRIVTFLGRPIEEDPPPIHIYDLDDAYAIIHLQHDMEEVCKPIIPVSNDSK